MKKMIAIITVITMFITTTVPALAITNSHTDYALLSTEELAYCDLDEAPTEMREAILAAREVIIFSTSWTVDGQVEVVNADGSVEQLPEFRDLFPDWDIPKAQNPPDIVTYAADFYGIIYLRHPINGVQTPPFYIFYPSKYTVQMGIMGQFSGTSWNGGFNDYTLGVVIGFAEYLSPDRYLQIRNPDPNHQFGARASTWSTEGYAGLYVIEG